MKKANNIHSENGIFSYTFQINDPIINGNKMIGMNLHCVIHNGEHGYMKMVLSYMLPGVKYCIEDDLWVIANITVEDDNIFTCIINHNETDDVFEDIKEIIINFNTSNIEWRKHGEL